MQEKYHSKKNQPWPNGYGIYHEIGANLLAKSCGVIRVEEIQYLREEKEGATCLLRSIDSGRLQVINSKRGL